MDQEPGIKAPHLTESVLVQTYKTALSDNGPGLRKFVFCASVKLQSDNESAIVKLLWKTPEKLLQWAGPLLRVSLLLAVS